MNIKSILLIDDEINLAQVVAVCLESFKGWKVTVANSGKEGLRLLETIKPDTILLDVMMPDMDGITVYQNLQKNPDTQHIPVIFLTAKVQVSDRQRFAQLGIVGTIAKPFEPLKIADQIAELLDW
ncbi:response regulator [Pseudanabaena sp. ABRG5-3]|uniref:response regulator n=1 Tax=Pseudanabaena sp. ABRG5-3 TaxID=685565 RepID=UPI000DC6E62C|nr:response regulator [Pseudanabaena sp. ABRG5-3]BBC24409.1 two-component response regulator [Pseudanabaena sp. ABRG5-3]